MFTNMNTLTAQPIVIRNSCILLHRRCPHKLKSQQANNRTDKALKLVKSSAKPQLLNEGCPSKHKAANDI